MPLPTMLCAQRKSNRQSVFADSEARSSGPFLCPECEEEVVLRRGSVRLSHFAHKAVVSCIHGAGETDAHRRCKREIYEALLREPGVTKVALERSLKTCRPDVSAYIKNVPVAIEVQISTLSMETIIRRTEEYARRGIYVLWLLQWTPNLSRPRYSPRLWEKWIHASYFGRVYYWLEGLLVASYHFEPQFERKAIWTHKKRLTMGRRDYARRSKRFRSPVRGRVFNLAREFVPKERQPWEANGFKVPRARLFMSN